MRPSRRPVVVLVGGVGVYALAWFAFARLGGAWQLLPLLLLVAVWGLGLWYWVERPARTTLRFRRLGLCERCGYDPWGNTTAVCPECGTPRPIAVSNGEAPQGPPALPPAVPRQGPPPITPAPLPTLPGAAAPAGRPRSRRRLFIGIALALPATLGALVWLWYGLYNDFNRVEQAVNVPRVDWLPPAATNVSYQRSYSFTAYEFDIGEDGFLAWAKDKGWPVTPVGSAPFPVLRYSFSTSRLLYPPDEGLTEQEWRARFDLAEAARSKTIRRGYQYERRRSDGGGVTVGYDLETGRAYYQHSPR